MPLNCLRSLMDFAKIMAVLERHHVCFFSVMRLIRYELILDIWRKQGNYPSS